MELLIKARAYFWVVPVVLGLVFVAGGAYMMLEGRSARAEVRDNIIAENIITAEDAAIPSTLVTDADTAKAQAEVIREHTLNITGGLTFAEMDREDPNRAVYLNSVNLRTALSMAVVGFKLSDLVIGLGAFMIVIGATHILFLAPAVYWAAQIANREARRNSTATQPGSTAPAS